MTNSLFLLAVYVPLNKRPRIGMSPKRGTLRSVTELSSSTSSTEIHVKRHKSLKQLELKAIALENQQRSAVINRSVVYEGEMIEGYEVVSIELQGVWLQRHGKKHLLTFTTHTAS